MDGRIVEIYKDYNVYISNFNTYHCPALALYDYTTCGAVKAAITREIKKMVIRFKEGR